MRRAFLVGLCCTLAAALRVDTTAQQPNPAPMLTRTGDVVYVALSDAKGAKLVADLSFGTDVSLWRKCGKWVSLTPAWLDWENSRVICGGYSDRGLEPGEYTLACRAGDYGVFDLKFTLEKGKPPSLSHKFETWRRVITLNITDEAGKRCNVLDREPTFYSTTQRAKLAERPADMLKLPLRERPAAFDFRRARGGGGGRSSREGKFVTDGGKWHLAVAAGLDGIAFGPFKFNSNFSGPEFDKPFDVTAEVDLDWLKESAKEPADNATDPGNRSAVNKPGLVTRVKFELSNQLLVPELDGFAVARSATGWEAVIPREAKTRYRLFGGSMFMTDWQPVPPHKDGITTVRPAVSAARIELSMGHETLAQWWDWCQLSAHVVKRDDVMAPMLTSGRAYATLADEANLKALKETRTLNVYFGGADGEGIPFGDALQWPPFGRSWSRATIDHVAVKLTDEQLGRLANKQPLQLVLEPRRVAFRAVTADGVGVPLAEASIIPLEEEKVALRLKERETTLAEKGKRPTIEQLEKALKGGRAEAEDITEVQLKEWLGAELYDSLGERDLRLRLTRHGAWYDTWAKAATDCHGYGTNSGFFLEDNVKYVLYLWGASRDDLKPDLRVEFTFKAGGTDLGALVVPGHS